MEESYQYIKTMYSPNSALKAFFVVGDWEKIQNVCVCKCELCEGLQPACPGVARAGLHGPCSLGQWQGLCAGSWEIAGTWVLTSVPRAALRSPFQLTSGTAKVQLFRNNCSKKSHPAKCLVWCSRRCWYFEKVNSIYLDQISGGNSVGRILWVGAFYRISYWPMDKILNVNADTDILILYKNLFGFQNELLKNYVS